MFESTSLKSFYNQSFLQGHEIVHQMHQIANFESEFPTLWKKRGQYKLK